MGDGVRIYKIDGVPYTGMVSEARDRSFYENGVATGKWLTFYQDGNIKSIENWKAGKLNGKYILYGKNRKKTIEEYYTDGIDNGIYLIFHDNGVPYIVGSFKNGKPSGKWLYYDSHGKLYGNNDFTGEQGTLKSTTIPKKKSTK